MAKTAPKAKAAPKAKTAPKAKAAIGAAVAAEAATADKAYHMHPFQRNTVEARANEVSKRDPNGPQFFVGMTSDDKGNHGLALIEVAPKREGGGMTPHWGEPSELLAILDKANA